MKFELTQEEYRRIDAWADSIFDRDGFEEGTLLDTWCSLWGAINGMSFRGGDCTENESLNCLLRNLPKRVRHRWQRAATKRLYEAQAVLGKAILAMIDNEPNYR